MRAHQDYINHGYVSIWAGTGMDQDALEDYLNATFANDFGFKVDILAGEAKVEPQLVEIYELLKGFSQCQSFEHAAARAAVKQGIPRASSMFVVYFFKYDPADIQNPNAPLHFIGAFPFSGFK